ncbi:MAG: hypothetical protein LUC88_04570 [Prevotella sp.]|nr:hypothetical protein [Prevotella sp.]
MTEINRQYFNDGQMYMLNLMPRDLVMICGRGFGKGAVQAVRAMNCFQNMPGSMGGFVAPSVKRCLTNILPSLLIHFERWGYKRDVHYVVGKKPWKKLKWKSPLFMPANWDNTIAFYNGSVINVISQDRVGTSNSMSLDYILIDEAKFIDFEQLKDETFQANRGNEMYFGKCYMHHGLTISTDMPITKKGSWALTYEKMMDKDLVEVMQGIVYKLWKLRNSKKDEDVKIAKLKNQLDFFRSKCLLYKEYTSIENLALLGEDFIRRAKRDLPPLTFATSIMCKRIGISADGFYGGMREDVNLYTAPNESVLNLYNLDKKDIPNDCRMDSDLVPDLPLIIAMDANANINWLVVGQIGMDNKLRILKSFFVKYERKIPELLEDFVEYYKPHPRKQVIFYYDATFVGNNYALHNDDFHSEVEKKLRKHQWLVRPVYIGKPMNHIEKNALINRMFRGRANHIVLINRDNNVDLLISIQSAGIYNGQKDKRGEKLAETEEDKLEGRTDGSDAFDTVCIGVEKFPRIQTTGFIANSYS